MLALRPRSQRRFAVMAVTKKRAMSVASLSPPTPYTALMSLLSVALSSATAKSNSMILPDACRVNIQPARKACSISAESLLNLSGIHAQFRRFGCAISVAYARQTGKAPYIKDFRLSGKVFHPFPNREIEPRSSYIVHPDVLCKHHFHVQPSYCFYYIKGDHRSEHTSSTNKKVYFILTV